MRKESLTIKGIPAIIWGEPSKNVCLYVHGQGGNKEEAVSFSPRLDSYSWQVLSIDLPEHGERKNEMGFDPWHAVPELLSILEFLKQRWENFALLANSIGAWFSMIAFQQAPFQQAGFISPVLDMPALILKMMSWIPVTEEELKKRSVIPTAFGQTLSWEYLQYARSRPAEGWDAPTQILYGEKDELIDQNTVKKFQEEHHCGLTVVRDGEHWFHTPAQLDALNRWLDVCFQHTLERGG